MLTVSQPKLHEDQRKQFIYMQNKAEKIIVELDIQLDNILCHQQNGPNLFSHFESHLLILSSCPLFPNPNSRRIKANSSDIQLDSDTKNHKNIRNVLQVVFWRALLSWDTRFDETCVNLSHS